MKKLNDEAAVELLYYVITIFVCGALFSLLFLSFGFPVFTAFIPDSDTKTFIMMLLRGILGIILIVGVIALIVRGIQKNQDGI